MAKAAIVVPARYASSRYPGKPLALLTGATGVKKPLIQRSWEAAMAVPDMDVYIATDDTRIADVAESFGAQVIMTSAECRNGTERCAEAANHIDAQIIVNLQGDAPLTPPWFVTELVQAMMEKPGIQVSTPVLACDGAHLMALRADRQANRVGGTTAVCRTDGTALYFSKEILPFTSATYAPEDPTPVYHHIGCYAYTRSALKAYKDLTECALEQLEGLEQLRFLDAGMNVHCIFVAAKNRTFWELNNPEDVPKIETALKTLNIV